MALLFGAGASDSVDVGDNAALRNLTAATYLAWAYCTDQTVPQRVLQKGTSGTTSFRILGIATGPVLVTQVTRATSNLTATAPPANFAAWGTNKWVFVVGVHDTGGANADQKVYVGDLTTLAAEPSSYSVQVVGSGAPGDNSTLTQILGNAPALTVPWRGRIAVIQIFNRALSQAEIHSIQFNPRPISGCVGYWQLGYNGTSTQPDWSGNANAGTVTGATVADHVPLPSAFSSDFVYLVEPPIAFSSAALGRAGTRGTASGPKTTTAGANGSSGVRGISAGAQVQLAGGAAFGQVGARGISIGQLQATGASTSQVGAYATTSGLMQAGGASASQAGVRGVSTVELLPMTPLFTFTIAARTRILQAIER